MFRGLPEVFVGSIQLCDLFTALPAMDGAFPVVFLLICRLSIECLGRRPIPQR